MPPTVEPVLPSGEQVELVRGDQRVVVTEVGAALRRYSMGDRAILDGFASGEMPRGGRGQVLAPWPNRLAGGRYRFGDEEHQVPLDEPGRGNANHGLVRWANWRVRELETDRVVMGHRQHPRPGYPFALDLAVEHRLTDDGLRVSTTATNIGDGPLPFGLGFHPYLSVGTPTVDEALLQVPAAIRLETDERGVPTGTEVALAGTPLDFRRPRPVGDLHLDTAFGHLDADDDGRHRIVVASPDGSRSTTLWMDRSFSYVMVFTGDTLAPDRRRRSLAVEPMTCAPDTFNNHLGLKVLAAGETTVSTWGIQPGARG